MNIAVIGLGYIGLPTAALFARSGHRVYGYDANTALRRSLQNGRIPPAEAAVRDAVAKALAEGTFHVVDRVPIAQAYVLCLPTPTSEGKADLGYVRAGADAIAAVAEPESILVLESTVPPGTTERIFEYALRVHGKSIDDYYVAHCPERVIPGAIMRELCTNARVVGGRRAVDAEIVRELYASFCEGTIETTSTAVAEFVKVAENTFRDVNIAFANELAVIAEDLGVDVWEAIELANRHPRVEILQPGPGVGGHCIPVDPQFLSSANPIATELIQSARRVNDRMPFRIVHRLAELLAPSTFRKIALLGAAYKADVGDARESPTASIDALLRERGYSTAIYDPLVTHFERPLCSSLQDAVRDADAIVLVTPHSAFKNIHPVEIAPLVRTRLLVDTRRFFATADWQRCGFSCYVLGRPFQPLVKEAVA
ncbi:MAG TPA: nucleotide sugar dehydrogenase [Candidatus Baltobacteraceae bacterium]|nr:nucleotide sugar dehydrogenase [Candidatus Baltobacteraceae bacterium]